MTRASVLVVVSTLMVSGCGRLATAVGPTAGANEIVDVDPDASELTLERSSNVVRVKMTYRCRSRLSKKVSACPAQTSEVKPEHVNIVIDDGSTGTLLSTGALDAAGSQSLDLDKVLPASFPRNEASTVTVIVSSLGSEVTHWQAFQAVCVSSPGKCRQKRLDLSDIVRARLVARRDEQDEKNKQTFATIKGTCGDNAPTLDACDRLRDWLATRAPQLARSPDVQRYIEDARSTLAAAEPALARLREDAEVNELNPIACQQATGPTANEIDVACAPLRQFLQKYPRSGYAQVLHLALDPADQRIAALKAKEEAAAKRAAEEAARREKAEAAAERAKEFQRCMGGCRISCANTRNFDQCFGGCPGVCQR